jgi:hypothetical protein
MAKSLEALKIEKLHRILFGNAAAAAVAIGTFGTFFAACTHQLPIAIFEVLWTAISYWSMNFHFDKLALINKEINNLTEVKRTYKG